MGQKPFSGPCFVLYLFEALLGAWFDSARRGGVESGISLARPFWKALWQEEQSGMGGGQITGSDCFLGTFGESQMRAVAWPQQGTGDCGCWEHCPTLIFSAVPSDDSHGLNWEPIFLHRRSRVGRDGSTGDGAIGDRNPAAVKSKQSVWRILGDAQTAVAMLTGNRLKYHTIVSSPENVSNPHGVTQALA